MELKSGYPYYLIKNGLYQEYETLRSDLVSDIIILGGGISGALMAYELVKKGLQCTIIDKRAIGLGSTCASTSLLQYEIDIPLIRLQKQIGKKNATEAYRRCSDAIDSVRIISDQIGFKAFEYCDSLHFSHVPDKTIYLKKEFMERKQNGFDVKYLEQEEIRRKFGFDCREAILSAQAAKIDAYAFTHCLHTFIRKKGVAVFENTCAKTIRHTKDGVELITEKGHVIRAKKLIYATGYESTSRLAKKIVKLRSTYACVSQRIAELPAFFHNTLLWNTADPYLYMKEDDGRIIIGGRDVNFYSSSNREQLLRKKAESLKQDFLKLFPTIEFTTQFAWAGTFGSTKDGLPYIGTDGKEPNAFYALGFGGNGITFSAIAAELIAGLLKNGKNKIPGMFSFNR
ncbi:MAG: FAD-binding oxidoreductase [Bacteroidetes bacterium]|nr:FAD-binding oxidoreductase [Bacteroidota bacterium]